MTFPICASCGETAPVATARFCEQCGAAFAAGAPPSVIRSSATTCRCEAPDFDETDICRTCGLRKPAAVALSHLPDVETAIDDRLAFATDKGRKYAVNQDAGGVDRRADGAVLMVVADGVSTSGESEKASERAVAAARAAFHAAAGTGEAQARACVMAAAQAVFDLQRPGVDAPSATIVLAILQGDAGAFAWVGDSRGYLIGKGGAELVTTDDSWAEDVVSQGLASREDAQSNAQAHAITQWLGAPPAGLSVNVASRDLHGAKAVVLCSDGLWNYLDAPGQFARVFRLAAQDGVAATACRSLVDVAYVSGGHDNITVAACLLGEV